MCVLLLTTVCLQVAARGSNEKKDATRNFSTHTADFIKKVLSVYTHSMATIYLSLSAQVAKSTFFMKPPISTYVHYRPYHVYNFFWYQRR